MGQKEIQNVLLGVRKNAGKVNVTAKDYVGGRLQLLSTIKQKPDLHWTKGECTLKAKFSPPKLPALKGKGLRTLMFINIKKQTKASINEVQ